MQKLKDESKRVDDLATSSRKEAYSDVKERLNACITDSDNTKRFR
jgi:hypothetical protein